MTERDRLWLAGFFDGEGCIVIIRKSQGRHSFALRCQIGNTCRPALERVRAIVEHGSIVMNIPATARHTQCWTYVVSGDPAADLLRALLPDLTVKTEQAMVAIEYADRRGSVSRFGKKWIPQSWECEYRERLQSLKGYASRVPGR